ncbi:MAG TPA: bifunctional phosphoribosyl-AMP cyclohydrolase/phosphoribosyl-ATP diphosphatase HisIE [Syntrophomonadaceae bacterium]|nr:bifunctional phosphoribosyl-AMP cyclohydrolase/phosphoribosyl-ATP diphosphatase HisIE [Syntrophomonadaceae bacterium]HPR92903.1 bifunctional phosphoribosyl-AMP cyclohydrolase/phosphoribosyl-ATP diphosphatase HisIE [Syntrophomonadaceae bacterium]
MISLKYDEKGLIPAIIQDSRNNEILMMAYMNEESLAKTIESGYTWFFSRSRQQLWMKGETSGNTQKVEQILYDCDADTLLIKVKPAGPACHTGNYSCFYGDLKGELIDAPGFDDANILQELYGVILKRLEEMPEGSYTSYLFSEGIDKILKKVGEESAEVIIAAKNREKKEVVYETADLIYHLLVMMVEQGVKLQDVYAELRSRS